MKSNNLTVGLLIQTACYWLACQILLVRFSLAFFHWESVTVAESLAERYILIYVTLTYADHVKHSFH